MDLKTRIFELSGLMSVSGNTDYDRERLMELIGDGFDECISLPVGGWVFVRRSGKEGAPKLLIDAHYDEIGMMVTGIKENGFLTVTNVGGVDSRILWASEVVIYGEKKIYGVVGSTPPHLQAAGSSDKLQPIDEMLIDTGYSKEELEKYVRIGTPVGFMPKYRELLNRKLVGKAFDDKACAACALHAISEIKREDQQFDIYMMLSNFEETSLWSGAPNGAFAVDPDVALVIDVDHAKTPDMKPDTGVEMGGGNSICLSAITDKGLSRLLDRKMTERGIKHQMTVASSSCGTDSDVMWLIGDGIPTVDIGLPLKSMHTSVEEISLDDCEALCGAVETFITDPDIAKEVLSYVE